MSTLGERIKQVRKMQNPKMSQTLFGEALGATRRMQTTYEGDIVVPDDAYKKLLCKTYHVNQRWLDTGEGDMIVEDTGAIREIVERVMSDYDEFTRRTIEQFLKLPAETRDQIFAMMRAIVGENEKAPD